MSFLSPKRQKISLSLSLSLISLSLADDIFQSIAYLCLQVKRVCFDLHFCSLDEEMEDDKFNNWVPPPASTPLVQQSDEFPFMNILDNENTEAFGNARNTVGADPVFFPPNQSSATPLPWSQMHGQYQTYPYAPFDNFNNNPMVDLSQPPNPQYHLRGPNNMNIAGHVPNPFWQNYPLSQRGNIGGAGDNFMNVQPQFSSFQNPGVYGNSSINRGNAREVIDLTLDDGDSNFGHTLGPQVNNPQGPGCGKSMVYQPQDTEVTSSFNQNPTNAAQFGSLRRADGSFLSLGNNCRSVDVPDPDFLNRLDAMCARKPMIPPLNFGGFSGFRNNVGGLPSSQNNMGGFSSVRNNVGTMSSAGYLPNTMPLSYNVQRPQANREYGFSRPSNSNIGFMPSADARYANVDPYDVLRNRLTVPSRPFNNSPAEISHPAQTGMSYVAPSSLDFSQTATQPTSDHFQKLCQESLRNNLARNVSSDKYMGSSFTQGQIPNSGRSLAQARNESLQHFMKRRDQRVGLTIPSPENYGNIQVPDRHGNPSLKRSMIYPNPSSPRVQRRKTMVQYPSSPYGSSRPQTPPAGPIHIPASRGGSGVVLKPSGNKCMICKRDLAFAPEGPIEQPSILPAVAVLPCKHTFHDNCLQLITPKDQKTDPPCIPCAMGEK